MDAKKIARLLGVLALATAGVGQAQTPTVVGAWTRVLLRDSAGTTLQPPRAPAFVIFSATGYFSQTAIPAGRPKLNKELVAMTKGELLAQFRYVDAWRGTYTIVGTRLTRKTIADVDPSGEGNELVQVIRFVGDTLILTRVNPADKSEARFVRVRADQGPAEHREIEEREMRNKTLIGRFYAEVWDKANYDVADEVFADNYIRNDPRGGNPPGGARGQKLIAQSFRKACPDCVMQVERVLADGDFVVGHWKISGSQQPSGQKVEFVGVNIFRFQNEKVVEVWNHRDDLAYALQTGRVALVQPTPQSVPKPPQ